jgi:hypothetical protein
MPTLRLPEWNDENSRVKIDFRISQTQGSAILELK